MGFGRVASLSNRGMGAARRQRRQSGGGWQSGGHSRIAAIAIAVRPPVCLPISWWRSRGLQESSGTGRKLGCRLRAAAQRCSPMTYFAAIFPTLQQPQSAPPHPMPPIVLRQGSTASHCTIRPGNPSCEGTGLPSGTPASPPVPRQCWPVAQLSPGRSAAPPAAMLLLRHAG